jgi:hypothetical protein
MELYIHIHINVCTFLHFPFFVCLFCCFSSFFISQSYSGWCSVVKWPKNQSDKLMNHFYLTPIHSGACGYIRYMKKRNNYVKWTLQAMTYARLWTLWQPMKDRYNATTTISSLVVLPTTLFDTWNVCADMRKLPYGWTKVTSSVSILLQYRLMLPQQTGTGKRVPKSEDPNAHSFLCVFYLFHRTWMGSRRMRWTGHSRDEM